MSICDHKPDSTKRVVIQMQNSGRAMVACPLVVSAPAHALSLSSALKVSSSTSHFLRMAMIVLAPNPPRIN
jgi:hypothetical protein